MSLENYTNTRKKDLEKIAQRDPEAKEATKMVSNILDMSLEVKAFGEKFKKGLEKVLERKISWAENDIYLQFLSSVHGIIGEYEELVMELCESVGIEYDKDAELFVEKLKKFQTRLFTQ